MIRDIDNADFPICHFFEVNLKFNYPFFFFFFHNIAVYLDVTQILVSLESY